MHSQSTARLPPSFNEVMVVVPQLTVGMLLQLRGSAQPEQATPDQHCKGSCRDFDVLIIVRVHIDVVIRRH